MQPVSIDGQRIDGVFVTANHRGEERLLERQVRQSPTPGDPPSVVNHDVYARLSPDGQVIGTFAFPVEKGQQTLSRDMSIDGQHFDLYEEKRHPNGNPVFRWATVADLKALVELRKKNQALHEARAKSQDPMHRDERVANLMAEALKSLATGGKKGGGQ